ncbi:MAG: ectonucleotide pyrophosphatase/phosphodiesterase [Ignavibacteriaceae bacterium]
MKKLFLTYVLLFLSSAGLFAQRQPYVILISLDGFRWDYVNRGITPNFDFIKANGIAAISLRPDFPSITFPNHYSIVTGLYPENQGLIANTFTDPFTKETYRVNDSTKSKNAKWYLGEAFWETAKRNGIITASYFWPGSDMKLDYRRPDYVESYVHTRAFEDRVNGVLNWLKLPYEKRPHFITLYFEATDDSGHKFGPNSIQMNHAIEKEDSMIGLLTNKLKNISLLDSTDIIVVSDHGMTEISKDKVVNIEEIIKNYNVTYQGRGPFMLVNPQKADEQNVYDKLLSNRNHFQVFTKDNIPACYHYSTHPFISDIIVIADLGWSLADNYSYKNIDKFTDRGNHGYDNNEMDMNGIFYAFGPDFKIGYRTATLNNIDIYPMLCRIFNISPRSNIDGKLENIEYILKGY